MNCFVQSIAKSPRTTITEYYYRALMECSSPTAPRFIIKLLNVNLPELSWYSEIGKRLELSSDAVVQRIATQLLEDTTIGVRIKATLDSRFAKRAIEQKKACRTILGL